MNTDRRSITIAAVLGTALLSLCAAAAFAGDQDKEKDKNKKEKPYALIFGTAYGPDDHPMYGVRVTIHPVGKNHPGWELISDHRGEFAQRVPPGPGDYEVTGVIEIIPVETGKAQKPRKKRLQGEAKVHIDNQERQDLGLHMME